MLEAHRAERTNYYPTNHLKWRTFDTLRVSFDYGLNYLIEVKAFTSMERWTKSYFNHSDIIFY